MVLGGGWATGAEALQSPAVTNLLQFQRLVSKEQRATGYLRLGGVVCWAGPNHDLVVIQDPTGAGLMEVDPREGEARPGQLVEVQGTCTAIGGGEGLVIGRRLLVDNDGSHALKEQSATLFLNKGKQPICVTWFNREGTDSLELFYEGPDLPRQRVPEPALSRRALDRRDGTITWVQGVDWQSYEGEWWLLPDFRGLRPVTNGTSANFSLAVKPRDHFVALRFTGYLEMPRDGLYTFALASAGGSQLFIGLPRLRVVGAAAVPRPTRLAPAQILLPEQESVWAEAEGVVEFVSRKEPTGLKLVLSAGTGRMGVELADGSGLSPAHLLASRVRVTGICQSASTPEGRRIPGIFWVPTAEQIHPVTATPERPRAVEGQSPENGRLPLLTRVEDIKRLKRDEAMRGYPVKIRGVITWTTRTAVVLQDATAGIFVDEIELNDSYHLRLGEDWEIEGVTVAQFSPMVLARQVTRLGRGVLPDPVRPARDQLMNGTLDAEYVEIQGIATAIQTNRVTLLTREGKIQAWLPETSPEDLKDYEGALIRIRGCLWAVKDEVTHVFKPGEVQLRSAAINVDEPPPADPFAAPLKRAAELLLFDAQAGAFKQVKVAGQIVHSRDGEFYLMDGTNGMRFIPRASAGLRVGDQVDVVGFPELGGPSPLLREAFARKTGQAPLPEARPLSGENWLSGDLDATLVQTEAQLMNLSRDREDQVMGLQSGQHLFVARLCAQPSSALSTPVGSRLWLKGVYAARGGNRATGRVIDSFELLLNSPADVRVLAGPSWWTFRRMLTTVGVLVGGLVAALVWISLLRRQVEVRTTQLRLEIQERERVKKITALEEEHARIARDLHDDLGSSLTEISLLADAGPGRPASLDKAMSRFRAIGDKAREVVKALDVIVWLVNPSKDALPFLAGYLGSYTEEYLSASGLVCRLKIPLDMPQLRLNADVRHNLFLAVKEVLHNIVRHAHASEVQMEFAARNGVLEIRIADNGQGFDPAAPAEGNGLANLRSRLAGAGGRCEISSSRGAGSSVRLVLPLPAGAQSA